MTRSTYSTHKISSIEKSYQEDGVLQVLQAIQSRWRTVAAVSMLGLLAGVVYSFWVQPRFQSSAEVLVHVKSAGLTSDKPGSEIVEEDILANHIKVLTSRRIVEAALKANDLNDLPSIQPFLEEDFDSTDYVIENLELVRGGGGDAKAARSLDIAFTHTDPDDSKLVLDAIVSEYQSFVVGQVESTMSAASRLVEKARTNIEADLKAAEQEYMVARREAPLFFVGEGSTNIYQDKYRRLEDELVNLSIEEAHVQTRYKNVKSIVDNMANDSNAEKLDELEKLALIDSESLERLGVFAGINNEAASTTQFMASQPERTAGAEAEYTRLLELMAEKQRLESVFGAGHPHIREIRDEIALVKKFLAEKQDKLDQTVNVTESPISPDALLKTYIGFLKNDLNTFEQRRRDLKRLSAENEERAKAVLDFEIQEEFLRNRIARKEGLYDGIVQQLRELDTASGLSGYVYELLETPRRGVQTWPIVPLFGLIGSMLGFFGGVGLASFMDSRDHRFRSSQQIESMINLPILGRISKLPSVSKGVQGLKKVSTAHSFEPFRMGRTFLLPEIHSGDLKTLGFSSSMQGDGKSMVAANFAVATSQVGMRVLVIDADLRRPSQHAYFSIEQANGLTEVITSEITPDMAIQKTEFENVFVMPAGAAVENPAELLQSQKVDALLNELSDQFDLIIVDLPPVLAVSDPLILAPRINGVAMVVRVANAEIEQVTSAARRLRSAGGNLVGCFVNSFGSGRSFADDEAYSGYYNSSYSRPIKGAKKKFQENSPKASEAPANADEPFITL